MTALFAAASAIKAVAAMVEAAARRALYGQYKPPAHLLKPWDQLTLDEKADIFGRYADIVGPMGAEAAEWTFRALRGGR